MTINDLLANMLEGNLQMLQATLGDFSDADIFVRPAAGANHIAWQLGHLCRAEYNLVSLVKTGAMPELPAGFADRFDKKAATSDDAKAFGTKKELLEQFTKLRKATIALAKSASAAELDKAMPENLHALGKNGAEMLAAQAGHVTMHVGQFQVIRRKLGKPVLF
ncbi:MAG TPA: DinB family protein [Tepidisphaeraceae bacterium]|jgi:hypothetical protein|nr:DinB family protein [Tepidisphaeraceae bacterium]